MHVSLEVAARRARQAAFEAALRERAAERVATAHTEDDQAETVLLRILRGAGRRGLAGIRPRRDHLVRPLLGIGRAELREFLRQRGHDWREDASNAVFATPRNRVRAELLPYLAAHFNPAVSRALARLADVAREDDAWLDESAEAIADRLVRREGGGVIVDVMGFARLADGPARRVARRALELANPGRHFAVREVDRLLAVVAGRKAVAEISGCRAERFGDLEVLLKKAPAGRARRRGTRV
jgi:tRNA(Ile)-lysidine synthase